MFFARMCFLQQLPPTNNMPSSASFSRLQSIWGSPVVNRSALLFIALTGVTLLSWVFEATHYATPLILGVIAAALAESDDNFIRRIRAQVLTLGCFMVATFSIELLFPFPWLFASGLMLSTVGFVMIGAIGPRYAKIAFGSLLIAIYTMLGANESSEFWQQPLLLLLGATWYFVISAAWYSIAPLRPVQQSLSELFQHLSAYFLVKRFLFHPNSSQPISQVRIKEAELNAKTVMALEECKTTFLSRSDHGLIDGPSERFLKVYFLAQDIHERISSSHYHYQELGDAFGRSDVMFRFKHLLELQAIACKKVASSIASGVEYRHDTESQKALDTVQDSIAFLKGQNDPNLQPLFSQLDYLFSNVATVEKLLANINNPDIVSNDKEGQLDDSDPHSIKEMWARIRSNLHPSSLLFRHAVRLSIALTLGYGVIQFLALERGYWILLTTLFVCQPNYSATKQKLVSRIIGTVTGLLAGVLILMLFPSQLSQMVFIVLSGVAFFALRISNYSYATAFITILVLLCFNQLGDGYALILPRLGDTLIGCLLAVGVVTYLFPDWQSRRIHQIMANSIEANREYLTHVIGQYRVGRKNDLNYRIVRRRAHHQVSMLTSTITDMLTEPGKHRTYVDDSFRFLTLNHALLSYISALGAHRQQIDDPSTHALILDAHRVINESLISLQHQLEGNPLKLDVDNSLSQLQTKLNQWKQNRSGSAKMVLQQLDLIYRLTPELNGLVAAFVIKRSDNSVS